MFLQPNLLCTYTKIKHITLMKQLIHNVSINLSSIQLTYIIYGHQAIKYFETQFVFFIYYTKI